MGLFGDFEPPENRGVSCTYRLTKNKSVQQKPTDTFRWQCSGVNRHELPRFAQTLHNGGVFNGQQLLTQESVDAMTRNQLPSNALPLAVGGVKMPGMAFGLGQSVDVSSRKMGRVPLRGEYGWDGMASTSFWSTPEDDITVVALTRLLPFSPQLKMAVRPLVFQAVVE